MLGHDGLKTSIGFSKSNQTGIPTAQKRKQNNQQPTNRRALTPCDEFVNYTELNTIWLDEIQRLFDDSG